MKDPMQSAIKIAGGDRTFHKLMECMILCGKMLKLDQEAASLNRAIESLIDDISKSTKLNYYICIRNKYYFKSFLHALPKKYNRNWLTIEFDVQRFTIKDSRFSVENILLKLT